MKVDGRNHSIVIYVQVSVDHHRLLCCVSILSALVCTAAMNDPKTSANHVKDGVKLLQKRTNPVELFVQKRVKNSLYHSQRRIIIIHLVGIFKKISSVCINGSYSRI